MTDVASRLPVPATVWHGLTDAQAAAVGSDAAPLCVLAAAGSGKTTVLTRRVARRVADGSARADHTVVVTFTRKASAEVRRRLGRLGTPVGVTAGTFHAVAFGLLRRHWAGRDVRTPALLQDPVGLVRAVLAARGVTDLTGASSVHGELHWAQVRMVSPGDYAAAAEAAGRQGTGGLEADEVAAVYEMFVREKARRGVIDLDDLVTRCAELLEADPKLAAVERWRVRHVFVDEFQDVNPAQWRLLSAWLDDEHDLFVVGDPQQAIYSWNGADPSLLDRLPELVPGLTVLRLDDNHRSTPQVLSAARAVLGDAGRAYAASRPDGPQPVVQAFEDDDEEATSLARWLRAAHRPGRPWSHLAVLARTNSRLEPATRALIRAGIPYRLAGNPRTTAIPGSTATWLRRLPRHIAVRSALAELAADDGFVGAASVDDGVFGLPLALARLADEHAIDRPNATVGEFLDWLAAEGGGDDDSARADGVELSTFHRAKGLEWPTVAVVGIEDGMVPIAYASTAAAVAEERRLLYVALTRAEDELWCSWARVRHVGERCWRCHPSPLLAGVEAVIGDRPAMTDPGHAARRVDLLRHALAATG